MPISLREVLRKRILEDVIGGSRNDKCVGTVLILDQEAADIISCVLHLPELIQKGVTMVENLEKTRKAYPSFRGVYLIAPTKNNINIIQNDFEKSQMYGGLYIYTTRKLTDENFGFLGSKPAIKKALSLKEANIQYFLFNEFVYELKQKSSLELQIDGLVSVISSLREVDSIEICRAIGDGFKDSGYLQKFIVPRIKELLPQMRSGGDGLKVKLFLIDRGIDLVSPLMHDFYYESLLADLMRFSYGPDRTRILNEQDPVYAKYRYEFIKEFMTGVSNDFDKFLKENPAAQLARNKKRDLKVEKMVDVVQGLGQYNQLIDQYTFHIDTIQAILAKIDKEKAREVGETEILLASGVDDKGDTQDSAKRLDSVRKLIPTVSEDAATRLALIAEGSLHRDCSSITDALTGNGKRVFQKYSELVKGFGKYWPEKDKDKFKKLGVEIYNKEDASLKRHIVKAPFLMEEFLTGKNRGAFETMTLGDTQPTGFNRATNTLCKVKINTVKTDVRDVVLVYFTGGISMIEIRALKQLEKKLGNFNVIVGGNVVWTPAKFIDEFVMGK